MFIFEFIILGSPATAHAPVAAAAPAAAAPAWSIKVPQSILPPPPQASLTPSPNGVAPSSSPASIVVHAGSADPGAVIRSSINPSPLLSKASSSSEVASVARSGGGGGSSSIVSTGAAAVNTGSASRVVRRNTTPPSSAAASPSISSTAQGSPPTSCTFLFFEINNLYIYIYILHAW